MNVMKIIDRVLVGMVCLGSIVVIVLFALAATDALINRFF